MRPPRLLALLVATATFGSPALAQSPQKVMGAPYHDPSRAFIDLMIPHHEMALMMSQHALGAARSDQVKDVARRMIAVQTREIDELKAARKALFGSDSSRSPMMRTMMQQMGMRAMHDSTAVRPMADSMPMRDRRPMAGHEGQGDTMSMMMAGDFDRMFLHHMISHHTDGMDLSILAEDGRSATRVKALAKRIRQAQERDVAEMRRLLATLPAATPAHGPH